ncbi:MAG: hypothetical protein V4712_15055 [Pseudomonadota bacterium]
MPVWPVKFYLAVALLMALSIGTAFAYGRREGRALERATVAAAIEASREAKAKLEAGRLIAQAALDDLAQQLEDANHARPVYAADCLSGDGVRRLNALR